jgi:hypothetical protein
MEDLSQPFACPGGSNAKWLASYLCYAFTVTMLNPTVTSKISQKCCHLVIGRLLPRILRPKTNRLTDWLHLDGVCWRGSSSSHMLIQNTGTLISRTHMAWRPPPFYLLITECLFFSQCYRCTFVLCLIGRPKTHNFWHDPYLARPNLIVGLGWASSQAHGLAGHGPFN